MSIRLLLLVLVLAMVGQTIALPAAAQENDPIDTSKVDTEVEGATDDAQETVDLPGSQAYLTRFAADIWESDGVTGRLTQNHTGGLHFSILKRGAMLYARLPLFAGGSAVEGNAFRLIVENRSACTEMVVQTTDAAGNVSAYSVSLPAHSEPGVYYAYPDNIAAAREVSITFHTASDGEIILYAINRVSFYEKLRSDERYGSVSDCYYDAQSGEVIVKGSLHTNTAVQFAGGSVALYAFGSIKTAQEILDTEQNPLQTIKITNHFSFSVTADSYVAKNRYYAVVLIDAQGNRVLMCPPSFPTWMVGTSTLIEPSHEYKGFYGMDVAQAVQCHAGAVIVDVYLDELLRESGGEAVSHSFENRYFSLNRSYVQQLEKEVIPLMKIGCAVYLRLSVRATAEAYRLPFTVSQATGMQEPDYLAILLTSTEAKLTYGAALSYLLENFSSCGRQLGGLILGQGLDQPMKNYYAGLIPLQEYLEIVTDTLLQTENLLRSIYPDAIVYLPLTDTDRSPYDITCDLSGKYDAVMLLDGVCQMIDDFGLGNHSVSLLLESERFPIDGGWSSDYDGEKGQSATVTPISVPTVSDYLSLLQDVESLSPEGAYLWKPSGDTTDDEFALAYIYLYRQLNHQATSVFFADVTDRSLRDAAELLAAIDTDAAGEVTAYALPYLGFSSWETGNSSDRFLRYQVELAKKTLSGYIGSYLYWNFAAAIGTMQWEAAYGCDALSADGGSQYGRALLAQMNRQGGEILYAFAKPENFSLCDALSVTLAVTDQDGAAVPVEVQLTGYGNNARVEAIGTLSDGDMTTLTLSGVSLSSLSRTEALSLRVTPLQEEGEWQELRVYVLRIEGMSRTKDSNVLQAEILAQRATRSDTSEDDLSLLGAYPLLLITALTLLTLGGAMMCLRKSGKKREKREKREKRMRG